MLRHSACLLSSGGVKHSLCLFVLLFYRSNPLPQPVAYERLALKLYHRLYRCRQARAEMKLLLEAEGQRTQLKDAAKCRALGRNLHKIALARK